MTDWQEQHAVVEGWGRALLLGLASLFVSVG